MARFVAAIGLHSGESAAMSSQSGDTGRFLLTKGQADNQRDRRMDEQRERDVRYWCSEALLCIWAVVIEGKWI